MLTIEEMKEKPLSEQRMFAVIVMLVVCIQDEIEARKKENKND